jgi:hypothetical protein
MKVYERHPTIDGSGKYFQRLHQLYQLKACPSLDGRLASGIKLTLSIKWALNVVFWLNSVSNIIRIFYFRMILKSFLAMATHKI